MHSFELLIDYIFPPSPNELLVRRATHAEIEKEYCPSVHNDVYFFSLYQRHLIKAAITTTKFFHNKKSARLLATLLTIWLNEHPQNDTLLIPIPLHAKRERKRGYNQVTRVLTLLSLPHVVISKKILKRNRHTTPQTKLDKKARSKNITGAFIVDTKQLRGALTPNITRIIICDDVYTTGSTLREAKKTLIPHLPKDCELVCLAWAH
jgi:ComF family protein